MSRSLLLLPTISLLLIISSTLLLIQIQPVRATITISDTGKQYHSRPASFGFNLDYGLQYVALLQVVEEDIHLCAGIEEDDDEDGLDGRNVKRGRRRHHGGGGEEEFVEGGDDDDDFWSWGYNNYGGGHGDEMEEQQQQRRRGLREHYQQAVPPPSSPSFPTVKTIGLLPKTATSIMNDQEIEGGNNNEVVNIHNFIRSKNETKREDIHVVPSNGVPVAIIAKRGQCTYETKARVASTLTSPHGTVRFVIVYDNLPSDGSHLITMMPKDGVDEDGQKRNGHELWKDVGLVFVSYESGVDLREFINTQPRHVHLEGGPRILIDGSDHWVFPPMDQGAAGLAFLLMLFGCVCSLSLFLNTTFYGGRISPGNDGSVVNDHQLFLLGPDGRQQQTRNNNNNNNNGRRGNSLRLLTMEEVETLPTWEYCSTSESSPLNSSLELRDKSDMPYLAEEDDGERQDSSLHDVAGSAATAPAAAAAASSTDNLDHHDDEEDSHRGGLCESLLPKKKDPDYFDHNSCSICLDEYELGEQIRVLPCQHTFHSNCIFPWLTERSPTCPLCKAMFEAVQYDGEDEEGEGGHEERAAAATARGDDDSVHTEASASPQLPSPPLEDEPPVHRRRQRREQRQAERAERQNERASRRSRRGTNSAAEAVDANDETPEAAALSSSSDNEMVVDEEEAVVTPESSRPSSRGLRGRLWGLFGAGTGTAEASTSAAALEEPLLTSDSDDGNDNLV
ncbi:hypothetical protein ACHAXR_013107 [Thalassiosira sp. AJA248-18]